MDEQLEQYRSQSLALCEKLIADLKRNQDDSAEFFGGEIQKTYVEATEKAINKAKKTRSKIRNL